MSDAPRPDSKQLRAVGVSTAEIQIAINEIERVVREVIVESRVEVPEWFVEQVSASVGTRIRTLMLAFAWSVYRAGVDRSTPGNNETTPVAVAPNKK